MISPILVTTVSDAQTVRLIRNEVRGFMTQNTNAISPAEQVVWFDKHRRSGNKLFLYIDKYGSPLGYGYIRTQNDERLWGTLAVLPEFHNAGYGTEIYKHLISVAGELWIEIFADNNPSLIAALKSGFEIQHIADKVIVLRAVKKND